VISRFSTSGCKWEKHAKRREETSASRASLCPLDHVWTLEETQEGQLTYLVSLLGDLSTLRRLARLGSSESSDSLLSRGEGVDVVVPSGEVVVGLLLEDANGGKVG
jgi:hypothetical protein